jgi:serine/threonine protein kinase
MVDDDISGESINALAEGLEEPSSGDSTGLVSDSSDRKYAIGDELARGGMGAVLNAKDVNIRRKVAMKVMLDRKAASQEQLLRFIEEAQVTGQLTHPNIVPVYELAMDSDGNPYYTMKMIKGVTLKTIIEDIRDGKAEAIEEYSLSRLLQIYLQACNGVAYAHSRGVVHRDLKPENIMVGEYGEVLVVDWGLAKILGNQSSTSAKASADMSVISDQSGTTPGQCGRRSANGDSSDADGLPSWIEEDIESIRQSDDALRTMEGRLLGTPAFMAPEQAKDASSVDHLADVYAMGAVLYNILTLRPPVSGSSLMQVMMKVVKGDIDHPSTMTDSFPHCPGSKIPDAMSAVAMKALETSPHDRYQRVSELHNDVQAYLGGFATEAEEAGLGTQLKLLVNRHRLLFGGLTTAMAVIIVLVTGFIVRLQTEQEQTKAAQTDTKAALVKVEKSLGLADQRLDDLKMTIPVFLAQAQSSIEQHKFEQALEVIDAALSIDGENAGAHNLRGNILQTTLKFNDAIVAYEVATEYQPDLGVAAENLTLSKQLAATAADDEVATARALQKHLLSTGRVSEGLYLYGSTGASLEEQIPQWLEAVSSVNPHVTIRSRYRSTSVEVAREAPTLAGIEKLRGLPIGQVIIRSSHIIDLAPLAQLTTQSLEFHGSPQNLTDLAPLKDMNLSKLGLSFGHSRSVDFSPLAALRLKELWITGRAFTDNDVPVLADMPLESLGFSNCLVSDLSPLRNLELRNLRLSNTYPLSFEPVANMPLESIYLWCNNAMGDVSPLLQVPLKVLSLTGKTDISPLRNHPTLKIINDRPAKIYWNAYDRAKRAGPPTAPQSPRP